MEIIKSLEGSGSLIKGVSETFKNEAKEQNRGFLNMLLGTLGVSLIRNLLTAKCTIRAGKGLIRACKGIIRADEAQLEQILKYRSINKTNLKLIVFIQERIYVK